MSLLKNIGATVAAIILLLGLLTLLEMTPASAKTLVEPGSVTCSSIAGSIKFSPSVTASGGASSEKITISTKLSNCAAGTGSTLPSSGSFVSNISESTNSCVTVLEGLEGGKSGTVTAAVTWSPKTIAPSTFTSSRKPPLRSPWPSPWVVPA